MYESLLNFTAPPPEQVITLSSLLQMLENSVRRDFAQTFLIKAEMIKLNLYKYSGHAYPDLAEKSDGKIIAQIRGIIWQSDFNRINDKFRKIAGESLKDGITVLCRVRLTFHALYGLSLIISDIDPNMTLGQMERERIQCMQRLKEEGLLRLNATKALPLLAQRLAVVSVVSSKGYNDFIQTLEAKSDKYKFFIHLFPSLLQGDNAAYQLTEALNVIKSVKDYFDCVLIIRGGGGDIGLHCYNDYNLCRTIAEFPLPVLTGIGHSTNQTVAETVSYQNFITPTALGEFFIDIFDSYYNNLILMKDKTVKIASDIIKESYKNLSYMKGFVRINAKNMLEKHAMTLVQTQKYIAAVNPVNILRKGYTLTLKDGKTVTDINTLNAGDEIVTRTFNGEITSIVK